MELKTIQIQWVGPFSQDLFTSNRESQTNESILKSKGLYQIYSRHPLYGKDSLIYIGQTLDGFRNRIQDHEKSWMQNLFDVSYYYFGRISNTKDNSDSQEKQINEAERLLIDFCKPGYNSAYINGYGEIYKKLIINYGKYASLPQIIGSIYYETETWTKECETLLFKR
jgi:hypothetical protein